MNYFLNFFLFAVLLLFTPQLLAEEKVPKITYTLSEPVKASVKGISEHHGQLGKERYITFVDYKKAHQSGGTRWIHATIHGPQRRGYSTTYEPRGQVSLMQAMRLASNAIKPILKDRIVGDRATWQMTSAVRKSPGADSHYTYYYKISFAPRMGAEVTRLGERGPNNQFLSVVVYLDGTVVRPLLAEGMGPLVQEEE